MTNKTFKRKSTGSRPAAGKAPFLKTVILSLLKLFEEDLPVTEFEGAGKFDTEVAGARNHQPALESICGGRSAAAHRCVRPALIIPVPKECTMRVEIEKTTVGHLKPADARILEKQLSGAQVGLCALKVSALIRGGRRRKNAKDEEFTVHLCLPPRPGKKAPPAEREP